MTSQQNDERQVREKTLALVGRVSIAGGHVQLDPDTPLLRSGILDSLALVELAELLEREFDVRMPPSAVTPKNFDTVATISALILGLKEATPCLKS